MKDNRCNDDDDDDDDNAAAAAAYGGDDDDEDDDDDDNNNNNNNGIADFISQSFLLSRHSRSSPAAARSAGGGQGPAGSRAGPRHAAVLPMSGPGRLGLRQPRQERLGDGGVAGGAVQLRSPPLQPSSHRRQR